MGYWLNNAQTGLKTDATIEAVKALELPNDTDNNIGSTIGLWNGSKYEKYSDVNYQNNKAAFRQRHPTSKGSLHQRKRND